MSEPLVLYFGPLEKSGHFMFYDTGEQVSWQRVDTICPWRGNEIDGTLQPGMTLERGHWHQKGSYHYGEAVVHHKDGWTALSFWDSTIDKRPGCSSTYVAKGVFTFEQMVALAKTRFSERWNKMNFEVKLHESKD